MKRLERSRTLMILAGVAVIGVIVWLGLSYLDNSAADAEVVDATQEEPDPPSPDEDKPLRKDKREVSDSERAELITRARIWQQPRVPVSSASLAGTTLDEVSCKFKITDLGGTTPKFDCELDGEEIRIKYGNGPEVPAEAAATRLLRALGFAADEIALVKRLRCYGCPKEPFSVMRTVELTNAEALYKKVVDFNEFEEFEWVALERKFNARPVETKKLEGWSFFELDTVDEANGGAPRAHVDALRIVAVLLAHWDNKSENQRLVCLSREWSEGTTCSSPLLLLQDVGATFGPTKFDLDAWSKASMWEDRATCTVSMRELPFEGATFGRARITEAGRQFAVKLLAQLSDAQLTELFTHARFGEKRGLFVPSHPVSDWVRAFKEKVRVLSEGPPCPAA